MRRGGTYKTGYRNIFSPFNILTVTELSSVLKKKASMPEPEKIPLISARH